MADVYNWQLGRRMRFPYGEAHPKKQFAAVFNINRCIGCQTCTMACKSTWTHGKGQEHMWWNNVETKPFGGYPQGWDVKTLKLLGPQPGWDPTVQGPKAPYGKYKGRAIFEAAPANRTILGYLPQEQEWRFPNIYEDTTNASINGQGTTLPVHSVWFFYLARICNHCTYPACLAACPRKAIYKRPEDGIVLVDQRRCRGYRMCMEACPYKKTLFNHQSRITEKCIGCFPRVEGTDPLTGGRRMVPRCIAACVGKIRLFGFVSNPENTQEDNPIDFLVHRERVALPLYPQFGTGPNVYYIPPRWVPREYLRQMFGPGVDQAIERYSKPSPTLLGVLQLFGSTQTAIASFKVTKGEAIGFDETGKEVVKVAIHPPVIVRSEIYLNTT